MRRYIEIIIGCALVGISILVQMRYNQAIKNMIEKPMGIHITLLCISLLSELPIIWMYRNSIAANQQEITGIVRALIFILVVQTLLSAVLSFTYRKKK